MCCKDRESKPPPLLLPHYIPTPLSFRAWLQNWSDLVLKFNPISELGSVYRYPSPKKTKNKQKTTNKKPYMNNKNHTNIDFQIKLHVLIVPSTKKKPCPKFYTKLSRICGLSRNKFSRLHCSLKHSQLCPCTLLVSFLGWHKPAGPASHRRIWMVTVASQRNGNTKYLAVSWGLGEPVWRWDERRSAVSEMQWPQTHPRNLKCTA